MIKLFAFMFLLAIPREPRTDTGFIIGEPAAPATSAEQSGLTVSGRVAAAPHEATYGGKYSGLLRVVPAPADEATYGKAYESGYYQTMSYAGATEIPAGYWVYVAPNWYIWQNAGHAKAAEDMMNKQVTVYLDNGTPVVGQLIESTNEYVVLHIGAAAKKKLIYKAKITSIEWPTVAHPSRLGHGPRVEWFSPENSLLDGRSPSP